MREIGQDLPESVKLTSQNKVGWVVVLPRGDSARADVAVKVVAWPIVDGPHSEGATLGCVALSLQDVKAGIINRCPLCRDYILRLGEAEDGHAVAFIRPPDGFEAL